MTHGFRIAVLGFLPLLVLLSSFLPAYAYAITQAGMDVIILLDTSGSMRITDPSYLRVSATELFVSLLNPQDTVGMIEFDSDARPIIDPRPVTPKTKPALLTAFKKTPPIGRYTNLHATLDTGLGLLLKFQRKQARPLVILLTDGKMHVGHPVTAKRLTSKLRRELIPRYREAGVQLYAIAFTKHADAPFLKAISEETGGFARIADTPRELHQIFASIFETVKQPQKLPLHGNKFTVDSSIRELILVVDKASPKDRLYLESPFGWRFGRDDAFEGVTWTESPGFAMITIAHPAIGIWKVLSSVGLKRAYVMTDLKLMAHLAESTIRLGKPATIEVWLESDGRRITKENILGKVAIVAHVGSGMESEKQVLSLRDQGIDGDRVAGDGVFAAQFIPSRPGFYQVDIIADGTTFERSTVLSVQISPPSPGEEGQRSEQAKVEQIAPKEAMKREASGPRHEMGHKEIPPPEVPSTPVSSSPWRGGIMFLLVNLIIVLAGYLIYRLRSRTLHRVQPKG